MADYDAVNVRARHRTVQVSASTRYGWCDLTISDGERSLMVRATLLINAPAQLIHAFLELARGTYLTAAAWGAAPGGVFIELARTHRRDLPLIMGSITIHEMADKDWIGNLIEPPWRPVRGPVQFFADAEIGEFLGRFVRALEPVRTAFGDGALRREWQVEWPEADWAELTNRVAAGDYR
jgi:hypothetical protein